MKCQKNNLLLCILRCASRFIQGSHNRCVSISGNTSNVGCLLFGATCEKKKILSRLSRERNVTNGVKSHFKSYKFLAS